MSILALVELWRSYRGLIIGAAWFLAFGGLLWYTHHAGYTAGRDDVQHKWDTAVAEAKLKAETEKARIEADARVNTEQLLRIAQAREDAHMKTMEKLRHEIATNRVYRDCVIPDSGMQLYRSTGGTTVADH